MSKHSQHQALTACLLTLRKKKPDWGVAVHAALLADDLIKLSTYKHKIDLHLCNYGEDLQINKRMDIVAERMVDLDDELKAYNLTLVSNGDPRGNALSLKSTNNVPIPTNSFAGEVWGL